MDTSEVEKIYFEAGVIFKDYLKKKLDEVMVFHKTIIQNRKEYLSGEILKLRNEIENINVSIEELSSKRAELMEVLSNHGALEEYTLIQERYTISQKKLGEIKSQLELTQYIEDSKSHLKIENQELLIKSRRDYTERMPNLEKAISIFRSNSESLYSEPGTLMVNLDETGYRFEVNIKRAKSQGVNYMKILCYDLMLMEIRNQKDAFPDFLVHDSTIFDGVDERQIARALELAMEKTEAFDFQYICLMNSDNIPTKEFSEEFKEMFYSSVIKKISDKDDHSGILGIRF